MTLILLLASAVGANGLNADIIWGDELASVVHMGAFNPPHTPQQVIQSIHENSPDHVPLYYLLGSGWSRLVGWSQFAMRYLSLLAGIMMLAWFYRFTVDSVDKRTALVAAFLMANNAFAIFYFHELRGYTLLLLLIVVHLWLYLRLIRPIRHSLLLWVCFVASATAMLYAHVLGLIMLAGIGLSHLIVERRSRGAAAILIGWAVGLGLLLPYLSSMLSAALTWGESERAISATHLSGPLITLLANGLGVLLIPLTLNLAYQLRRRNHPLISRLMLLSTLLGAILVLLSWMFDLIALNRMRYFFVLWIPCMILISYSLTVLTRSISMIVILTVIWAVAGYHFGRSGLILEYATLSYIQTWEFPPLQDYVYLLQGKVRPSDFVVGFSESLTLNENRSNYDWSISDYYFDAQLGIDGVFLHTNLRRYRLEQDVQAILMAHPQILLAHDPSEIPLNYARTLATVQEQLLSCDVLVDEPTLVIRRYVHPVIGCNHEAVSIKYDNGIKVVDRAVQFDADAELINVLTWWDVPNEASLDEYNISLQIITSKGQNIWQIDRHLYDNIVPWSVIELSTDELPAGDYRLMLILYHRVGGAKVTGVDSASATACKFLHMKSISLE